MNLTLRYMRLADIPQVVAIDKVSFDPPWSARSYAYEVTESTYSHMVVLEMSTNHSTRDSRWRQLLRGFTRTQMDAGSLIVGYGGLWNIVDEAHISTIATHPDYRGRGWGEILLLGMLKKSCLLKAGYVVLEVRVSNTTAQNLYRKHYFVEYGVKARYYQNNGEDAYDMRLDLRQDGAHERIDSTFGKALAKYQLSDDYTEAPPPRIADAFEAAGQ